MPLYLFKTDDDQFIQLWFSMSNVPKSVQLQNGKIAYKQISVPYLKGTTQIKQKIKLEQTQKNIDAGNRGKSYWTNRMKELK